MTHMLHVLPAELVSRIFSFFDDRQDVARCRLVCKTFHELSSPFLITQVVFAFRLDTIQRMREVVEHPYFSKYVDTLVYDVSKYSRRLAIDWMGYTAHCLDAPRSLVDDEWIKRKQADAEVLSDLARLSLSGDGEASLDHGPAGHGPMDQERLYQMGCQKTFPEYYLRFKNQRTLGVDVATGILADAFRRLPKLRNVVLADYRSLAKHGESYDSMCKRLFGLVLAPEHQGRDAIGTDDFLVLVEAMAMSGVKLHSLAATASHPFLSTEAILGGHDASLQYPASWNVVDLASLWHHCDGFHGLQELELSYEENAASHEQVGILLGKTPDLERLCLTLLRDRKYARRGQIWAYTEQPSMDWLLSARLPCLRYLDLRHLQLPSTQPLQQFLERHAYTVRELRLIECFTSDRAGEQDKLALWAGENLHLAGVEVLTAGDLSLLCKVNTSYMENQILDEATEKLVEEGWGRIEVREAKYLNGRSNSLCRTVDIADRSIPIEHWEQEWWLRPCRM